MARANRKVYDLSVVYDYEWNDEVFAQFLSVELFPSYPLSFQCVNFIRKGAKR